MPNFTGINGVPSRTNTSLVDVCVLERAEPAVIDRGWQTQDFNVTLRGLGRRDDKKTPTA